jgi:hypothetical protein
LAGFRIDHQVQKRTQLFLHFVISLNLIIQSVITKGSTARVRHHPESKKQPDGKDKEELPLQSS